MGVLTSFRISGFCPPLILGTGIKETPLGGDFLFLRSLFCYFSHDAVERFRVLSGDGGEHLAVESDAFRLQQIDEAAVLKAVGHKCCVDADGPQATEVILLVLAVREGIKLCVIDRLTSGALLLAAGEAIALYLVEDIATTLLRHQTSFYTCHRLVVRFISGYGSGFLATVSRQEATHSTWGHEVFEYTRTLTLEALAASLTRIKVVLPRLACNQLAVFSHLDALGE